MAPSSAARRRAPAFTILLENGEAFVAPGMESELPLAVVACSRSRLMGFVQGKEPLAASLPDETRLAEFLSAFQPTAAAYNLYRKEGGDGGGMRPRSASASHAAPMAWATAAARPAATRCPRLGPRRR